MTCFSLSLKVVVVLYVLHSLLKCGSASSVDVEHEYNDVERIELTNALLEDFKDDNESAAKIAFFLRAQHSGKSYGYMKDLLEARREGQQSLRKEVAKYLRNHWNQTYENNFINVTQEIRKLLLNSSSDHGKGVTLMDVLENPSRNHSKIAAFYVAFFLVEPNLTPEVKDAVIQYALSFVMSENILPNAVKEKLITTFLNTAAIKTVPSMTTTLSKNVAAANIASVKLAVVHLSAVSLNAMYRWWKGDISGTRCAKICFDAAGQISGSVAGGAAGAAISAKLCPMACIGVSSGYGLLACPAACVTVSSALGGYIGGEVGTILADWVTSNLFNLPHSGALENAYRYLDVEQTASNNDINNAYRRLAITHHPDKGGSQEKWLKLQFCMQVIKLGRGE